MKTKNRDWWGKVRVGKANDRRIKLDDADRAEIKKLYAQGLAIRKISRMYPQVCRRTIQFVLFPDRSKACNPPGHYKKYYDKDKRREYMRRHREHIRQLNMDK